MRRESNYVFLSHLNTNIKRTYDLLKMIFSLIKLLVCRKEDQVGILVISPKLMLHIQSRSNFLDTVLN